MERIHPGSSQQLHGILATHRIEALAQAQLPKHALMQRAGLAVAKLAVAIAPHADRIWIACGPGNNGGDGMEAALHLHQWGKQVVVTWLGNTNQAPSDAAAAYQRAIAAGVAFSHSAPNHAELSIDALLGIGARHQEAAGTMASWINQMNTNNVPVLAIDAPTGLDADSGAAMRLHIKANHTLSLLTLKPGLFTAQGRDACANIWFDDLGLPPDLLHDTLPDALLLGQPAPTHRNHASHKGNFGDVAVVAGGPGMTGAALLAATAALHSGAGRVFVGLLDSGTLGVDVTQPELMFRPVDTLDFATMTVVCGCGGGTAVHSVLPRVLASDGAIVLDADALNAIAANTQLQALLTARSMRSGSTVLTPHPLEAARLLQVTTGQVQGGRLAAATEMANRFACTVVLKGSGTVIATPAHTPAINPTGNAQLATAGTGDVLAGMVGAKLAAGRPAFQAACEAVYQHGHSADTWPASSVLSASKLARRVGYFQKLL